MLCIAQLQMTLVHKPLKRTLLGCHRVASRWIEIGENLRPRCPPRASALPKRRWMPWASYPCPTATRCPWRWRGSWTGCQIACETTFSEVARLRRPRFRMAFEELRWPGHPERPHFAIFNSTIVLEAAYGTGRARMELVSGKGLLEARRHEDILSF